MQGESECLSDCGIVPDSYEYKWLDDTIVPLKNPVGEDIRYNKTKGSVFATGVDLGEWLSEHVAGSACRGNTNLVPEFCRVYAEYSEREVLAVHVAKGSTAIADWLPGSAGYDVVVQKTRSAMQKVESKTVFFVWLQGESDAIAGHSKDDYKAALSRLGQALKRDLGIGKFGVIQVGRFANDDRDEAIMSAQEEICAENEDFIMLTNIASQLNRQSQYMNPFIPGHYSAAGLEKLGAEAGKTLGIFVREKSAMRD